MGKPYGTDADIWAFGILMRVLLSGYLGKDTSHFHVWRLGQIVKKFLNLNRAPHLPECLSTDAAASLSQLLNKKFSARAKTVEQVKLLPFFKSVDWERVKAKGERPPMQPAHCKYHKDWIEKRTPLTENRLLAGNVGNGLCPCPP